MIPPARTKTGILDRNDKGHWCVRIGDAEHQLSPYLQTTVSVQDEDTEVQAILESPKVDALVVALIPQGAMKPTPDSHKKKTS